MQQLLSVYSPLSPQRIKELLENHPKPENSFTLKDLMSRVASVTFQLVHDSQGVLRKTVAEVELDNGFQLSGESVVVDPANFNQELGQHFAYMDAINKLWVPLAFHTKEVAYGYLKLTPAELQSGTDRVKWAEGLIRQLPETHEGRNSWLLNYGVPENPHTLLG